MSWAFVHPASGAIVMVTTARALAVPVGLDRRPAPVGIDPANHWWNGWSFSPRESAPISAALEDEAVTISCPADAWLSLPDGSITAGRALSSPRSSRGRVTMVGRYRGEIWIEPNSTLG